MKNQQRHDFIAMFQVRRILRAAKYIAHSLAEMRSEWMGPHTRNERETRMIGLKGSRLFVNLNGTGGNALYQRTTTGTDPTDYESVLDYICEHPAATVTAC
jgi:hypothetical protein